MPATLPTQPTAEQIRAAVERRLARNGGRRPSRRCLNCDADISDRAKNAKTCSTRCRVALHRSGGSKPRTERRYDGWNVVGLRQADPSASELFADSGEAWKSGFGVTVTPEGLRSWNTLTARRRSYVRRQDAKYPDVEIRRVEPT
jgi:hypothetical protein